MRSDSVSIIIPIYNEEAYLHRCVQSVISQTHRDLEIILVDDGSTDGSADICDRFAMQDSRIRVIHQDNQGLSAARNAGLDIATSGYIQFVDSDDWILPTMTEELLSVLREDASDVAQCDFYKASESSENELSHIALNTETSSLPERNTYSGDALYLQLPRHHMRTVVQWNKLFKKEIFDDLQFPVGKLHEDEFVIHRELIQMNSLSWLGRKLYVYTENPKSITHQRTLKNSIHICEAYLDRARFYVDNNIYSVAPISYAMLLRAVAYVEKEANSQEDMQIDGQSARDVLRHIREEIKAIPTKGFI